LIAKERDSDMKKYDLVVIGGGAAGLVASVASAALGANTALVEKSDRLGGECSWTGCVPSKALITLAMQAHRSGLIPENVMTQVNETVKKASESSKVKSLLRKYKVDIYFGGCQFVNDHTIETANEAIEGRKFILCTGSHAVVPKISGLTEGYLTSREIWNLEQPPRSMLVIGGGPIGTELAQAFSRLGTKINLFQDTDRLLPRDDEELSKALTTLIAAEGVDLHLNHRVENVSRTTDGWEVYKNGQVLHGEKLLVALGRAANVEGLQLDVAGVEHSGGRISVNKYLRTTAKHIWAAGDCTGNLRFSHAAELEAKAAVRNALFPFNSRPNYQGAPWATFTDPELAHLGMTEAECKKKNIRYRTYYQNFSGDDRAITDGTTEGKVKILSTPLGKLLGVHILGPRAGELINEFVLARRKGARIYDIGLTVHVYPTLGMAAQRASDQWFAEWSELPWAQFLIRMMRR
jgi:pyruvate/2-oxoglutarate dehydrogenase complex dihydrolipoamide dehydrogenase (E3) component